MTQVNVAIMMEYQDI